MRYRDRAAAGRALAPLLEQALRGAPPLLLGIARGGVLVARAAADALGGRTGVVVAVKITHPWQPEFALGALTADGPPVWNEEFLALHPLDAETKARYAERARAEARRREARYGAPTLWPGHPLIVVDDGLATGLTALAAWRRYPEAWLAAPVASPEAFASLKAVGRVIVPLVPPSFTAVGAFYERFPPVSDEEVLEALS